MQRLHLAGHVRVARPTAKPSAASAASSRRSDPVRRLPSRRDVPADVPRQQALINGVTPIFTDRSRGDEWRPNDKLDVSLALQYADDGFTIGRTPSTRGEKLLVCGRAARVLLQPGDLRAGARFRRNPKTHRCISPYVRFICPIDNSTGKPVQTVHPDGKDGHLLLSNMYPPVYVQTYWQPRFGAYVHD